MGEVKKYWYHIIAIFTIIVWGTTFVSTKVLINYGLSPVEIFVYRYLLAYVGIWFFCVRKLVSDSFKDELLLVGLGLGGGSLYFIFENTALGITLASNVSLIICTAPIFTAFLSYFINKDKSLTRHLLMGSFMALSGVALVVFNGSFILKINPLGDILTILSALSWAFYSVILKRLSGRYPVSFITRKVFFYGLVTMLPFLALDTATFHVDLLLKPIISANLLFLAIVASLLCFIFWNTAVKELGVMQTSNYIYFVPLVTLLTSAIVIDEQITFIALLGSIFIVMGVYVAEKGFPKLFQLNKMR